MWVTSGDWLLSRPKVLALSFELEPVIKRMTSITLTIGGGPSILRICVTELSSKLVKAIMSSGMFCAIFVVAKGLEQDAGTRIDPKRRGGCMDRIYMCGDPL